MLAAVLPANASSCFLLLQAQTRSSCAPPSSCLATASTPCTRAARESTSSGWRSGSCGRRQVPAGPPVARPPAGLGMARHLLFDRLIGLDCALGRLCLPGRTLCGLACLRARPLPSRWLPAAPQRRCWRNLDTTCQPATSFTSGCQGRVWMVGRRESVHGVWFPVGAPQQTPGACGLSSCAPSPRLLAVLAAQAEEPRHRGGSVAV